MSNVFRDIAVIDDNIIESLKANGMHLPCGGHNAPIWMIAHKVLVDI